MPRYQQETQLIVNLDGKIAGWTSVKGETGTFHGDKTLAKKARIACSLKTTITLYNSIKLKANTETIEGAYAAFASYGLERLEVIEAPDGFLHDLGLEVAEVSEEDLEYFVP